MLRPVERERAVGVVHAACLMLLVSLGACGKDEALLRSRKRPSDAGQEPSSDAGKASESPMLLRLDAAASPFGLPCSQDGDCGGDAVCLRAEGHLFFEGGPAGGYCSLPCSSDQVCHLVDSNALCAPVLGLETVGYCVLGCTPGKATSGLDKCRGRPELACEAVPLSEGSPSGFCRPLCLRDENCPEARVCHLGTGVCVDAAQRRGGAPIGAPCSPASGGLDTVCEHGVCLIYSEDYAICSGRCNTATIGCGSDSAEPGKAAGAPACLSAFRGSAKGDVGRCGLRCNCTADCLHPQARCWVNSSAETGDGTEALGARGLCVSPGYVASNPEQPYADDCEATLR